MLAEIIPEGVDRFVRELRSDGIGPTLCQEPLVTVAGFGLEEGVVAPGAGIVNVEIGGDDVVVAGEDDGLAGGGEGFGVLDEAFEPGKFVFEFRAGLRIPVGEIKAADENAVDRGLNVTTVRILVAARKLAAGFDGLRAAREDGDAVP